MAEMKWRVDLICCGRDDGYFLAATWEEADRYREAYCTTSSGGHQRSGVLHAVDSGEGGNEV